MRYTIFFLLGFFLAQPGFAQTGNERQFQYRLSLTGDPARYYVSNWIVLKMDADGSMKSVGNIGRSESPDFWATLLLNGNTFFIKQDATTVCTYSGSAVGRLSAFAKNANETQPVYEEEPLQPRRGYRPGMIVD